MAATRKLTVEILGDAKGALGAFGSVNKGLGGLGDDFVNFGKKVALGFAAFTAGAIVIGKDLVGAASDLNENLSKTEVVFGDAASAVIDFSKKAATAFGQSQTQALEAAGNLGIFGKAAGLTGDDLSGFTTDLIGLASDMASFSNTTPQEAIDALGAALRGEAEPIRKYGVLLDDAAMRQKALEMGIYDGNGSLTAQQKILAANALIFEQTADAQGDFARTSDGLANRQRVLAAQFQNLKTSIGTALLPVALRIAEVFGQIIEKIGPLVKTWLPKAAELFKDLADRVKPIVSAIGDFLAPILEKIVDFLKSNIGVVKVFFGVIAGAAAIAAVVALAATFAALFSPITLIIGAIAAAAAGLYYAYTEFEGFRNVVDTVGRFIRDTFVPLLVQAWDYIKDAVAAFVGFFSERMDSIKAALVNIREFMAGVLDFLQSLWRNFGDNILNYVGTVFNGIKTVISGVLQAIKGVVDIFLGVLSGDWGRAWDGIKNLVGGILGTIKGLIQTAVAPIVFTFGLIGEGIGMGLNALKELVINVLGVIRTTFSTIFGTIYNIVTDIFRRIGEAVRGAFVSVINFIVGKINAVVNVINSLIRGFNRLPGPDVPTIPNIPALAKGGIVTGPTVALIGEAGPEAVVPLSGPYQPDFLKESSGGAQVTNINIQVEAGLVSSPDQVGQQIIEAIRRAERRSGQVFASV
jgi:phage-related protein